MFFVKYHSWKKNYKTLWSKEYKTLEEAIERNIREKNSGKHSVVFQKRDGILFQLDYPTIPFGVN